jgi:hypothetical protein
MLFSGVIFGMCAELCYCLPLCVCVRVCLCLHVKAEISELFFCRYLQVESDTHAHTEVYNKKRE